MRARSSIQCEQCKRLVKTASLGATHLFNRPNGSEAWLCGPRCLARYNAGEDVPVLPGQPVLSGQGNGPIQATEIAKAFAVPVGLLEREEPVASFKVGASSATHMEQAAKGKTSVEVARDLLVRLQAREAGRASA